MTQVRRRDNISDYSPDTVHPDDFCEKMGDHNLNPIGIGIF